MFLQRVILVRVVGVGHRRCISQSSGSWCLSLLCTSFGVLVSLFLFTLAGALPCEPRGGRRRRNVSLGPSGGTVRALELVSVAR